MPTLIAISERPSATHCSAYSATGGRIGICRSISIYDARACATINAPRASTRRVISIRPHPRIADNRSLSIIYNIGTRRCWRPLRSSSSDWQPAVQALADPVAPAWQRATVVAAAAVKPSQAWEICRQPKMCRRSKSKYPWSTLINGIRTTMQPPQQRPVMCEATTMMLMTMTTTQFAERQKVARQSNKCNYNFPLIFQFRFLLTTTEPDPLPNSLWFFCKLICRLHSHCTYLSAARYAAPQSSTLVEACCLFVPPVYTVHSTLVDLLSVLRFLTLLLFLFCMHNMPIVIIYSHCK